MSKYFLLILLLLTKITVSQNLQSIKVIDQKVNEINLMPLISILVDDSLYYEIKTAMQEIKSKTNPFKNFTPENYYVRRTFLMDSTKSKIYKILYEENFDSTIIKVSYYYINNKLIKFESKVYDTKYKAELNTYAYVIDDKIIKSNYYEHAKYLMKEYLDISILKRKYLKN